MIKKYNYQSVAYQFKMIFIVWGVLFLLFALLFSNEKKPLWSEMIPVFFLLFFATLISIATYYKLKRTYVEITDDGIHFNGLRKKVYSTWQGVRKIKVLGRKHRIYTYTGNFSIGYLEPADMNHQSFFDLLKTEGKYSKELVEEIKKLAPHVEITYSIFLKPL